MSIGQKKNKKFGDELAPGFDFSISGTNNDFALTTSLYKDLRPLIASVMFEDDIEMSSLIEIELINQAKTETGLPADWRAVIDSKAFQEGNYIDLYLGYGSEREFMDRCEIVKWLPTFPEAGPTTVKIKAYDGRHRMAMSNKVQAKGKRRKTYYKNYPDEAIVQQVADKYGYATTADKTEANKKTVIMFGKNNQKTTTLVLPTRVQMSNQSDWKFLRKLAMINNFDLWVDYDKDQQAYRVNFRKKPATGRAIYQFEYGGGNSSLLTAEPHFSIKDHPTKIEVLMYDTTLKEVELTILEESNKAEDMKYGVGRLQARKSITKGARVRFSAFGRSITVVSDKPFVSKKEAERFVEWYMMQHESDFLVLQGKVVGLPSLRSRQVHEFIGMSARLDGIYRLTNTKHHMKPDGIYVVEFTGYKVLSGELSRKPSGLLKDPRGPLIHKYNRHRVYGSKDTIYPKPIKKK